MCLLLKYFDTNHSVTDGWTDTTAIASPTQVSIMKTVVLGKLLFKSNCLQLLVTDVKSNYLLYFLQNLKSNMLQLQLLFKSKDITFVINSLSCRE